jgi:hypothetical protein
MKIRRLEADVPACASRNLRPSKIEKKAWRAYRAGAGAMRRSSSKKLKMNVTLLSRVPGGDWVAGATANRSPSGCRSNMRLSPRCWYCPSDQSRGFLARNKSSSTAFWWSESHWTAYSPTNPETPLMLHIRASGRKKGGPSGRPESLDRTLSRPRRYLSSSSSATLTNPNIQLDR